MASTGWTDEERAAMKEHAAEIRRAQAKITHSLSAYELLLRALACVQEAKE